MTTETAASKIIIGDEVFFVHDGVKWQGRVNDIRYSDTPGWDAPEGILCVSVLGWPHMFYLNPHSVAIVEPPAAPAIRYKGYRAITEYDREARIYHGTIAGIRDVVTFEAPDITGLIKAFGASVDDYLAMCAERNETPEPSDDKP